MRRGPPGHVATSGAALRHGFDLAFYVLAAITAVAAALVEVEQRQPGEVLPNGRGGAPAR
jgi:hypothetical protein